MTTTTGRYEALIRSKTGTLPETMTTAELAYAMGVSANTPKSTGSCARFGGWKRWCKNKTLDSYTKNV
jgi:hypothetical protein